MSSFYKTLACTFVLTMTLTSMARAADELKWDTKPLLRAMVVGNTSARKLEVSGGDRPYSYSMDRGNLPKGFELYKPGPAAYVIFQSPGNVTDKHIGSYSFKVTVRDSKGRKATQEFKMSVVSKYENEIKTSAVDIITDEN